MAEIVANNRGKEKQATATTTIVQKQARRNHQLGHQLLRDLHVEEAKLAGLAISFNICLRAADMPSAMQERALRHARALLDSAVSYRRPNPTLLARSLKKEFDSVYGPAWHCIAGKSFGSFVTHSPGGFLYFSVDSLCFLLFKTQVHVIAQPITKA